MQPGCVLPSSSNTQLINEKDWEKGRKPYYNLWPSIVPMLTRLDLDLDSALIRLPLPALCIRFPKDQAKNPLKFDWKGDRSPSAASSMGDMNQGEGISVLIDIGEVMPGSGCRSTPTATSPAGRA